MNVYRGSASGFALRDPLVLEPPTRVPDEGSFGASVASPGDANGDGYDDLLVAMSASAQRGGQVYVFGGSAAGPSRAPIAALVGPRGGPMNFGRRIVPQ